MEPSDSKIKIFFQKKAFLIFQPMLKKYKKSIPRKIPYISGNGTF